MHLKLVFAGLLVLSGFLMLRSVQDQSGKIEGQFGGK